MAAQQEEGWPLGLNLAAGVGTNRDRNASHSFNTWLTSSSPASSSDSSSDLDTESTGSFFHNKSITLGTLIGISSLLDISRRSTRGRVISEPTKSKKNYKMKPWFLSLCSRLSTDVVNINTTTPSLGHFLQEERRAAESYRRNPCPNPHAYGPDDFSNALNLNSLFLGGQVAPPQLSRDLLVHENSDEPPLILSCLCGNLAH